MYKNTQGTKPYGEKYNNLLLST